MRSNGVCGWSDNTDEVLVHVVDEDTRRYGIAYPKTRVRWMLEGAGKFNDRVNDVGVTKACETEAATRRLLLLNQ